MLTQNRPGCPAFLEKPAACGWRGGQGEGDVYIHVAPFIQGAVSDGRVSKGVRPLWRCGAWGLCTGVMFLVCQALMGSVINRHIFSK